MKVLKVYDYSFMVPHDNQSDATTLSSQCCIKSFATKFYEQRGTKHYLYDQQP